MTKLNHSFPAVTEALKDARSLTFRGNTFGQLDCYYRPSKSDKRIAEGFDPAAALIRARQRRLEAGIRDSQEQLA